MLKEIVNIIGDTVTTSISSVCFGVFDGIVNGISFFTVSEVWPILKEKFKQDLDDEENTCSETNQ